MTNGMGIDYCLEAFEEALKQFGREDAFGQRSLDEGAMYWLWGKAIEAAKSDIVIPISGNEQPNNYAGGQPERLRPVPSDAGHTPPDRQGKALIADPPAPNGHVAQRIERPNSTRNVEGSNPSVSSNHQPVESCAACNGSGLLRAMEHTDHYAIGTYWQECGCKSAKPVDCRELAEKIIAELDQLARDYEPYEFGLPRIPDEMDRMIAILTPHLRQPMREYSGWISVTDRLPESDKHTVLVVYEAASGNRHVMTARYSGGEWRDFGSSQRETMVPERVSYWQPKPVPPAHRRRGTDND